VESLSPFARNKQRAGAALAGQAVSGLGFLVMLGWVLGSSALIQVSPAFAPMQFNTALGFLVAGTALLMLNSAPPIVARLCGAFTAILGAATLCEYLLTVDLGIDELFMDGYINVGTSNPGRMAPNTALGFLVSGLTLLLLAFPRLRSMGNPWIRGSGNPQFGLLNTSGSCKRSPKLWQWQGSSRICPLS
jgi:hypothetical protein